MPTPKIFRTYAVREAPFPINHEVTFMEAGRATSAAVSYFAPIEIGGVTFEDAGPSGVNNPSEIGLAEVNRIKAVEPSWENRDVLLVSIGTGVSSIISSRAATEIKLVEDFDRDDTKIGKIKGAYSTLKAKNPVRTFKTALEFFGHLVKLASDTQAASQRAWIDYKKRYEGFRSCLPSLKLH